MRRLKGGVNLLPFQIFCLLFFMLLICLWLVLSKLLLVT